MWFQDICVGFCPFRALVSELKAGQQSTVVSCLDCLHLFFINSSICEKMSTIDTANIKFKWDPKSLEIRTLAVERLLEPLVTQVNMIVQQHDSVLHHV